MNKKPTFWLKQITVVTVLVFLGYLPASSQNKNTKAMCSLASSSKQPPHHSLSSPACFVFSESDRTEDETSSGVSSEGEGDTSSCKPSPETSALGQQAPESPEARLAYGERCSSKPESGRFPRTSKHAGLPSVSAAKDPKNGEFYRKCAELHGYVRPLLELLNGLKTGRYDRGLSTFQHSVAMDRLQRIVGILQKPTMGEKYMHTLLQVEMMLKVWFPQVAPSASTPLVQHSTSRPPPHWHQHQLPVKKRRLSWSYPEPQSLNSSSCKRARGEDQLQPPSQTISGLARPATAHIVHGKDTVSGNEGLVVPESVSIHNLETGSGSLCSSEPRVTRGSVSSLVLPPPSTGGCCLDTQDCWVSSTTLTSGPC